MRGWLLTPFWSLGGKLLADFSIDKPWFYRVLQNKVGDRMRSARHRVCCDLDSCRFLAVPDPAAAVDAASVLRIPAGAFRKRPERARAAFPLKLHDAREN